MSMVSDETKVVFNTMWESEKKTVAFAAGMWKQRDAAYAFILSISEGSTDAAPAARQWLRENTCFT